MPRYLTSHNMACMTRQGARELAERLRASTEVEFLRLLCNMTEGQMLAEFNAVSREALQRWLEQSRIHFEWLRRIDFEATRDAFHDL
jgi:hypothetical protein